MVSIEVFEAFDMSSNLVIPVSSRSLMVVISGSQPEDARSSRVGSYYAACPGGEVAVLKTVGLRGLARSNRVCGV